VKHPVYITRISYFSGLTRDKTYVVQWNVITPSNPSLRTHHDCYFLHRRCEDL